MDDEDFLEAVEADNASTPVIEEPKPEPLKEEPAKEPETPAEPPQPAPEELVLTPEQIIPPKPEEMSTAPIAALLDERDKRKAAEAERDALRAQQQPAEVPDPYADPEGFAAYQENRVQIAIQSIALNTSERFARKEHGAETVEAAKQWALQKFASDPLYHQQVLSDPDPYERTVRDYQREQLFSQVSDPKEIEQFRAWKQAQGQLQQQPGALAPLTSQAPAIPSPSLASASSAGSILTEPVQSEDEIFDEVIRKR